MLRKNIILLLFSLFLINTNISYSQPNISKTFTNIILYDQPRKIPSIQIKDQKGKTIIFSDFSSKITLINFWATWCAPCKEEMPKLDKLVSILGKRQVTVLAVNIESISYSKAKNFLDKLKVKNFDTFFDPKLKLTRELTLKGVPTTLVLNQRGNEIARILGDMDFDDEKFIEWIKRL